jgi:hypothetical protein
MREAAELVEIRDPRSFALKADFVCTLAKGELLLAEWVEITSTEDEDEDEDEGEEPS